MFLHQAVLAVPLADRLDFALDLLREIDGSRAGEFVLRARMAGLTRLEALILNALAQRFPNPVTHDALHRILWPDGDEPECGTLPVHLMRLRRKLDVSILNVRGIGYRLSAPVVLPDLAQDKIGAVAAARLFRQRAA